MAVWHSAELTDARASQQNAHWVQAARGHAGHQTWEEIVQAALSQCLTLHLAAAAWHLWQAALSWKDVADSELFIAVHVPSAL